MIKKIDNTWLVDMYPNGREGKRIRKKFKTKAEAQRFEKYVLNKSHDDKEWAASASDNRKLSTLVELWYSSHGQYLRGAKPRRNALLFVAQRLGDPTARLIKPSEYTQDREARIKEGISPKTCNNELGYVNAVFNELERTGEINYANPLKSVRPIKLREKELTWLTNNQISTLLDSIDQDNNKHLPLITRICLSTGARWGEAEGLTAKNVRNKQVIFTDTKSGKIRSIPLENSFYNKLKKHMDEYGRFTSSIKAFRRSLKRSGIQLPEGQATHVLRHSFASHFMMNGGNILTLQKIMGHASITMTMRYAHLAPEHLQEAANLNPLVKL